MPTGIEASKRKDGKSDFSSLTDYIKDARKTQGAVWVFNVMSPQTCAIEMESVASKSTRCKDPAYHFMISWPKNENPNAEQAKEAGLIAISTLGADISDNGHQFMIALHKDTGKWHIHVALNRVHPATGLAHHIKFSHKTLHQACRAIEMKQGWQQQKGLAEVIYDVDGKAQIVDSNYRKERNTGLTKVALDVEKHTGKVSFQRYIKEVVGPRLKQEIKKGTDWQQFHQVLGEYNVKIVESGGGFAFKDLPKINASMTDSEKEQEVERVKPIRASASTAGSFAKSANLIKKLGDYQFDQSPVIAPITCYDAEKLQRPLHELDKNTAKNSENTLKNRYEQETQQRHALFSQKRKRREKELTVIKKQEDRALQDELNEIRITAFRINKDRDTPFPAADINLILRTEREKKRAELKKQQQMREKTFADEFAQQEKTLKKHNSYHRWLYQQTQQEGELTELARIAYQQSENNTPIQQTLITPEKDQTNHIQAPIEVHQSPVILTVSQQLINQGYHADIQQTKIAYSKDKQLKFTDRGHTINITTNSTETVRDALLLAQEKWGDTIRITGSDEFQIAAAKMAHEIGLKQIQTDNQQALEIFNALKHQRTARNVALDQEKTINYRHDTSLYYTDFSDRAVQRTLNTQADLLEIVQCYGYKIEQHKASVIRLTKQGKVLNISQDDSDLFSLLDESGEMIANGSAIDFIRYEQKNDSTTREQAAEQLFVFNRHFEKTNQPIIKTVENQTTVDLWLKRGRY